MDWRIRAFSPCPIFACVIDLAGAFCSGSRVISERMSPSSASRPMIRFWNWTFPARHDAARIWESSASTSRISPTVSSAAGFGCASSPAMTVSS